MDKQIRIREVRAGQAESVAPAAEETVNIREIRAPKDQGTITLYEERAQIAVTGGLVAQVTLQKRIVEEEVQVPVTLQREVLELITSPEGGSVMLDGQLLEPGRVYQITLTEERPVIGKQVFPVQQINVRKEWISQVHQETVTLGREVLDVSGPEHLIREAGEPVASPPPSV
ncbi:YsnF/AvaK domain-containing protein [Deinococcus sp.]|uniref:YsnF/AvaK domain-containing protein n=1 Tax=Deinococcus sp. TaxID=47478 RepID=UPI0025E03CFD|nr:YsnF/AvaK domain-containing protein [Deinococcus sp.]